MGYGGTILIPRSPHGDVTNYIPNKKKKYPNNRRIGPILLNIKPLYNVIAPTSEF
jgi:hypothetical protein